MISGFNIDFFLRILFLSLFHPYFALIFLPFLYVQGYDFFDPVFLSGCIYVFFVCTFWGAAFMSRKLRNGWTSDRTDWDNEIVVVTGGSRGIGGLLVETIALRNVSVIILDLAPPEVENGNVAYYKCDVSRFEEVERVAKQILIDVGHPTIVINNAGIIRGKTILDESHEEISKTIGVNLLSSFWTTKVFLPDMVKNNHGHIVTISSAIAYTGVSQAADYSASKAGLLGFHESLRFELHSRYNAKKVRTTLVCPGKVGTELFAGVEVSSPFFTPQLAPLDVVKAIITALDKNEGDDILIPYYVNLLPIIRFLPGFMIDLMRKFSGLDECMKTWVNKREDLDERKTE